MSKPYWTLPMAVAWITSKSAGAVRDEWNDWRKGSHRRRRDEDGCYWKAERAASLAVLIKWDSRYETAWYELRNALLKGEAKGGLSATGISTNGGGRVDIPAAEWNDLDNYPTGPDLVEKFRHDPNSRNPDRGYDEILVERDDVLQLVPAVGEATKPDREKKRRGRPHRYTPECEAAARRIAAEKKASRRPSDKSDTALIKAFQEWWEDEYDEPKPVDETVRNWLTIWGL